MLLTVRRVTDPHDPALAAFGHLQEEVYYAPDMLIPPAAFPRLLAGSQGEREDRILVAEQGGEVVGGTIYSLLSGAAFNSFMGVARAAQGQGAGRALHAASLADVRAAGLMGQLRIALRAYASEGHRPDAVLSRASRFLHGMTFGSADDDSSEPRFATCLYVEVDPASGLLDIAREVVAVADDGLKARARAGQDGLIPDERRYLEALKDSVESGRVPADELLAKYHGEWQGDLSRIYAEYSY